MTFTRAELFHGDLALTKQHLLDVLAHPDRFDWIPDGAHVIGLPQNNRGLFEENMKLAHRIALRECFENSLVCLRAWKNSPDKHTRPI